MECSFGKYLSDSIVGDLKIYFQAELLFWLSSYLRSVLYTVLYLTVLYLTVLSLLYCTALYCGTALYCAVLYCTVLYCTALYCTALYCTVPYCTVLYLTVLYCTVLFLYWVELNCMKKKVIVKSKSMFQITRNEKQNSEYKKQRKKNEARKT